MAAQVQVEGLVNLAKRFESKRQLRCAHAASLFLRVAAVPGLTRKPHGEVYNCGQAVHRRFCRTHSNTFTLSTQLLGNLMLSPNKAINKSAQFQTREASKRHSQLLLVH
eukprot:6228243-Amphidinium_carterae.1